MTSRIEFLTIKEDYPFAGRNNDSQGFRDNFTIIKDSLTTANAEMTDLQKNAARTDQDNDFANNTVERVNLKAFSQLYKPEETKISDAEGNKEIVISEGHYQTFIVGSDSELSLTGWPTDENYSSVIVELIIPPEYATASNGKPIEYYVKISSDGGNEIYREPATVWRGGGSSDRVLEIKVGRPYSDDEEEIELYDGRYVQVFKFWTYNGGETIFAKHLGNYDTDPEALSGNVAIYLGNLLDTSVSKAKDGDFLIFKEGEAGAVGRRRWTASKVGLHLSSDIDGPPSENGDRGVTILDHKARTITADLFGDANSNIVTSNQVKLRAFANNSARDQEVQLPVGGEMVFVTDVDGAPELQGHDGDKWVNMLGGGGGSLEVIEVPGTFSILSQDVNKFFRVANPDPVDVIIKAENTDTIKVGESFSVIQAGEGTVSILPDTGVIVNSVDGSRTARTRYSAMTMIKVNTNEWDLIGDLLPSVFECGPDWDALGDDQYKFHPVDVGFADGGEWGPLVTPEGEGDTPTELPVLMATDWSTESPLPCIIHPVDANNTYMDAWTVKYLDRTGPAGQEYRPATYTSPKFDYEVTMELFIYYYDMFGVTTTPPDFAADEFVLYFSVDLSDSYQDVDVLIELNRNEHLSVWENAYITSSGSITVLYDDYLDSPERIYKVSFPNPGEFNAIAITPGYYASVTIHYARLCKDGAAMTWPLTELPESLS